MRGRIVSVIGERVPLELLTHRPLSPAQLAEIQVLLSSRSIANFAFTFCHLVYWVAFGRTQRDASQDSKDDGALGTKDCVECEETDKNPPPNYSNNRTGVVGTPQPRVREDVSKEQRDLNQGHESLKKENSPFTPEEPYLPSQVDPKAPENIFKEELMRLRGAEGSTTSLVGGGLSRVVRRYGVLQHPSEAEPIGEAPALESCEELLVPLNTCRKRLKVLAAAEAAYQEVMEKIKVCF